MNLPEPQQFTVSLPHGVHLSCRAMGAPGRPLLLFLHGFPEGAFVWDAYLAHFCDPRHGGYRCVAPNLRGFERSSAPADVASYRARHLMADVAALIEAESPRSPAAAVIAHDWGGAVAWNLAAQQPGVMQRLVIVNSPHPGAFWRELRDNPDQQAASAYMNFLIRSDAEALLAADDFRRLWTFFTAMGADDSGTQPGAGWLTEALRQQYRELWAHGLTGPLNYYRASPLRPPTPQDPGANAVALPDDLLRVQLPTQVIWGMGDTALPGALLDGLTQWVPRLTLQRVPQATHWILHEQPAAVMGWLQDFLSAPDQ